MPLGPGRYDFVCTELIKSMDCEGVVVIICGGKLGSGNAVQGTESALKTLPDVLRALADEVEMDVRRVKQ